MLCVEDYLDALKWAAAIGLDGLIAKSRENLRVVEEWVEKTDWIAFLAASPETRSNTSVCLVVTDEKVNALPPEEKAKFLKGIGADLSRRNVAHDINAYKDAPPGFRFWCGPTIEAEDLKAALRGLEEIFREKISAL